MNTAPKPKTLADVRDELCKMYAIVMDDPRRCAQVHEGANALGKSIGACKIYLEYCKLASTQPRGDWKKFINE